MCCAPTTKKIKVLFLEVSLLKTIVPLKKKNQLIFNIFFPNLNKTKIYFQPESKNCAKM